MNFEAFSKQYAARFRPLGDADGLTEWIRDIDKPEIEAETMRMALNQIEDHHHRLSDDGVRTIAAPRLGEVMIAYRRVAEVRNTPGQATPGRKRSLPLCGVCDSGHMWILLDMENIECVDPRAPSPTRGRTVIIRTLCTCQVDRMGRPGELPAWYTNKREVAIQALSGLGDEVRVIEPAELLRRSA